MISLEIYPPTEVVNPRCVGSDKDLEVTIPISIREEFGLLRDTVTLVVLVIATLTVDPVPIKT